MFGSRRWGEWRLLAAIVLVALAVRVLLVLALRTYDLGAVGASSGNWTFGYEAGKIAESLARGDGFASPFREPSGPTAWLMPIYPWLVGAVFRWSGIFSTASAAVLLLFNCVASALTCVPIHLIGRRVFGTAPALLAAAAWALYPPSILHAVHTIWDTTLFTLLGTLLILGLYGLQRQPTRLGLALYGAGLGLATLVKSVALAYVPFVLLWVLRRPERSARWKAGAMATVVLTTLLATGPWVVRNFVRFDRAFLRSNLGLELSLGNSDRAWRDYVETGLTTEPWYLGHPSMLPEERERFEALGEVAYVDEKMSEAQAFMLRHPGRVLRMTVRRIGFYWLLDPHSRSRLAAGASPLEMIWRLGRYLAPLALMLPGIGLALKRRADVGPLLGYLALLPAIYYLTHVSGRYRIPIEPCVVLFAAYGVWWLLRRFRSRGGIGLAALLSAAALLPGCNGGPRIGPGEAPWERPQADAGPCAVVPALGDWEYVGPAIEPGAEGEFDHLLWGGFGGSPIKHGTETLLYYQGAEAFSEVQQSVRYRAIGLATSVDGTTFVKAPANPVLRWTPNDGEEEGAASVAVGRGPDGTLVAFYGANTLEGPTTINADGRWATSTDGRTFVDRGIALDHTDRGIPGSGDELFPVIAFFHRDEWYVYYLPNGVPRGRLGVAWGPTPDALSNRAPVRSSGRRVRAWGMQTAVRLCGDRYALFLNRVTEKTMTVHLLDASAPAELSEPVATYRFGATGSEPEFVQGAVLLDRESGFWYLYYRTGDRSRYDVRRATLVTRGEPEDPATAP